VIPAKIIYMFVAVTMSVITARHMVKIHGSTNPKEIWHEYVLNFFGTLLGWASTYYFLFYRLGNHLEIIDLILILIAYIGITGYLPHLVINKGFKP